MAEVTRKKRHQTGGFLEFCFVLPSLDREEGGECYQSVEENAFYD
jgi:hypothetical protein